MALLRLSTGEVYTAIEDINQLVAPLTVGHFDIPAGFRETVACFAQPISQSDAMGVLAALDPSVHAMVEKEGFTFRRVGNVVPVADGSFQFVQRHEGGKADEAPMQMGKEQIAAYRTPHYVQVNDWHFVFSGAIIKGVQLTEGVQAVIYCQAGDWIRLNPTILNWPIFPFGQATVAISYYDRSFEQGPFEMDVHPEVEVLDGLSY